MAGPKRGAADHGGRPGADAEASSDGNEAHAQQGGACAVLGVRAVLRDGSVGR